jgi:pimeloyl-ACP methyl ester carboxylesterase
MLEAEDRGQDRLDNKITTDIIDSGGPPMPIRTVLLPLGLRVLRMVGLIALGLLLGTALLLALFQDRLIYLPRTYASVVPAAGLQALAFTTDEGRQVCYLRPPAPGMPMHRLWLFFGGNGSLAQDWNGLIANWRRDDALLLIEYPGYGASAGKPSPGSIGATTTAAISAAGQSLGVERTRLLADCVVVGHSLGAAAALMCADREPSCSRLVLVAPFTSLADMARHRFGWPLCLLLRSNYDNVARLRSLAARAQPPRVVILHGADDLAIPASMGRTLAAIVPGTSFQLIPDAGHNDVLDQFDQAVAAAGG